MRCPPQLIFPFSISQTCVLSILFLQGWVKAFSLRRLTLSPLHLSTCSLCLLLSSCSFFKRPRWKFIALIWRYAAVCLNLSVVVFILPFEKPPRANRIFVDFCALHPHHWTTYSCCLKSCLLVYCYYRNSERKAADDVRLNNLSKLGVSSFMGMKNLGIEAVVRPLLYLNSRFSLLFMFSNFLALSVVPWPLKHAEWEFNFVPHHRNGLDNAC